MFPLPSAAAGWLWQSHLLRWRSIRFAGKKYFEKLPFSRHLRNWIAPWLCQGSWLGPDAAVDVVAEVGVAQAGLLARNKKCCTLVVFSKNIIRNVSFFAPTFNTVFLLLGY